MSSNGSIEVGELKIAKPLFDLIQAEMAPGTGVDPDSFWKALGEITRELGPKNRELLEKRDRFKQKSTPGTVIEKASQLMRQPTDRFSRRLTIWFRKKKILPSPQ